LFVGIAWIVATRNGIALPGALGADVELRKASIASQGGDFKEAIQRSTHALEWAPLKWQLYFARAIGKVGARRPSADALEDFRRARFLEPNAYEVPYQEGIVWLKREPTLALSAWQEALRRVGVQRLEVYGHMLALAAQHGPIVRQGLEKTGVASADLALVYLRGAAGAEFKTALQDVFEHHPDLTSFSDDEKARLFTLWGERGDLEALVRATETHPDWMKQAWRPAATYQANHRQFRSAFELVSRFGPSPPLPQPEESSIEQLQQAFRANPDNFGTGYQLYREQIKSGGVEDALMTARHFTERPDSPSYFRYLEAEAWAKKENWERAWNAWKEFEAKGQK
jgi:tetratricopeptide (TPR) repeat protein